MMIRKVIRNLFSKNENVYEKSTIQKIKGGQDYIVGQNRKWMDIEDIVKPYINGKHENAK